MRYFILTLTIMGNIFFGLVNAQTIDQKQGKCLGATMLVHGVGGDLTPQVKKIQSDLAIRFSPLYSKVNSCTSGSASVSLMKSCATKLLSKNDADFYIELNMHMDSFDSYVTKDKSSMHILSNCGEFLKPR